MREIIEGSTKLLMKDKHLNAIQNYCPWLLRYLAAAVVINKKGRRSGDLLKKVVRVTEQERYTYKDPITQFVEALYLDFDFDVCFLNSKDSRYFDVKSHFR